ncbi:MAG: nucleoside triphosphate pyrophosphatase [Pyrinomonadaceae bacterium]
MINRDGSAVELPPIILASGSPRRAEILESVGWQFVKQVPDVDESVLSGEDPSDYVRRLAGEKALAICDPNSNDLVLAADTTVVIDGEIIGKPVDRDDARQMIERLSGSWHEVLTGVAVARSGITKIDLQSTRVKFAPMDAGEIEFLVERGDPLDKAGGYAVQAQAALFIEAIEGDYWNVVGLPISLVYRLVFDK